MEYEQYANLETWVMGDWSVQMQYFSFFLFLKLGNLS